MNWLPQFFPSSWTRDHQVFGIPFTDEISIGFVTRDDGAYSYLQVEDFDKLKVQPNVLLNMAVMNLDGEFDECEIKEYKINGGKLVYWGSENDNFTAVRILSGKYARVLLKIFGGDFNFSVPNRDQISCWKTDSDNENTKFAIETAEDYKESDYNLSDKVYKYSNIKRMPNWAQ